MQTFLPLPRIEDSIAMLDPDRLWNQRNEALVLWRTNTGYYTALGKKGWPHHPAAKMWRGYDAALATYHNTCIDELDRRKVGHSMERIVVAGFTLPPWLGDDAFHASHRAALLYKNPAWYAQFGWTEKAATPNAKGSLPYVWPR